MNTTQLLVNITARNPKGSILTICQKETKQTGKILFRDHLYFVGAMFTGNTPKIERIDGEKTIMKCLFELAEGEYCFQYKIREHVLSELSFVKSDCCNIIDFYVFDSSD